MAIPVEGLDPKDIPPAALRPHTHLARLLSLLEAIEIHHKTFFWRVGDSAFGGALEIEIRADSGWGYPGIFVCALRTLS